MRDKRLLIVDDEENMRELLKDFFEDEGFKVQVAGDGMQALDKMDKSVNIVISDNRMPVMEGMELLDRLKAEYPETQVIIITAYSTPKLAVEAYKRGAAAYITKPFNPDELLKKVKEILRVQRMTHRHHELEQG
jgi:DNA-binding NtrC family response regulator